MRWEPIGRRRVSHGAAVGRHMRVRREPRREHHSWRRRSPGWHDGRNPWNPWRIEIRRGRGSVRDSSRKGSIHGAHWGSGRRRAAHSWISFWGNLLFTRTRLSVFLLSSPEAVFSVGAVCQLCRVRGSYRETSRVKRAWRR